MLMLHGLGQRADVWKPVSDHLPPSWGIIAPSLYGFGTWAELREFLVSAVEQAGEPGKVVVCGLSAGGRLGMDFALHHPEMVAGLHVSGASLKTGGIVEKLRAAAMKTAKDSYFAERGVVKAEVQALAAMLPGVDLTGSVSRISVPTRVLSGAEDKLGTSSAKKIAGLIPGAELDVVANAGHEWNAEAPETYAANIAEFVAKLG